MNIFSKIADFINPNRIKIRESIIATKREQEKNEEAARQKIREHVRQALSNIKEDSKKKIAYPRSTVTYPVKSEPNWQIINPVYSTDAGTPVSSFIAGGGDFGGGGASASSCASSSCGGSSSCSGGGD